MAKLSTKLPSFTRPYMGKIIVNYYEKGTEIIYWKRQYDHIRVNLTLWARTAGKKSDTTVFNPCPFFIAFLDRSCCPAPPGKLFF